MNLSTVKNRKSKNKTLALSLIAILAISLSMAFAQTALAQINVIQPEKTVGFITVAPTLIGVGQDATVNLWVFPLPTTAGDSPYFNGFFGLTVTFVAPDGTKDTFMPTDGTHSYVAGETEALGAIYFNTWSPDQAGNWSVSFTMPAQNVTDPYGTVQYAGCTSSTFAFTVQSGIVLAGLLNGYPWAQLPNANVYWTYPINANNREWSAISGDWTGTGISSPNLLRWQPYGTGPASAHIVWTNPVKVGGMVGGQYGSISWLATSTTCIIMDGRVYFNVPNSVDVVNPWGQFECVDESTGAVVFIANGTVTCGLHLPSLLGVYTQTSLSAGATIAGEASVLLEDSYGSYVYPYLWSSVTYNGVVYWNYYDAYSGNLLKQIANCSSSRLIDGTVLAFGASATMVGKPTLTGGAVYVYRWNETSVTNNNWPTGITWVEKAPTANVTQRAPSLFAISQDASTIVLNNYEQYWGINAATGASLWNLTLNYQTNTNEEIQLANVDDFIIWQPTLCAMNCYSIDTGALLWTTPSVASSPWATAYTIYTSETNDLNNLYLAFPDGSMRAYSLTDGHLIWTSTAFPSTEYANNAVPCAPSGGLDLMGGNLYIYMGYSTAYQLDPIPRFGFLLCINATTGDATWTLNGAVNPNAAANGYVIGTSIYDGNLYCVGKGQTSTTVTAQQQVGGSVLIQGSVMDNSQAQPNTPAISDANMSVWMDYLHMQNATLLNAPPDCMGVPVTLTAISSTGTTVTLGTVTSDGDGHFAYQWTPTTAGLYTIYATFAGTNSYFESYDETSATVAIASTSATVTPTPTVTPTTTTAPSSSVNTGALEMYLVIGVVVIVIAIAIATVLLLRKKP